MSVAKLTKNDDESGYCEVYAVYEFHTVRYELPGKNTTDEIQENQIHAFDKRGEAERYLSRLLVKELGTFANNAEKLNDGSGYELTITPLSLKSLEHWLTNDIYVGGVVGLRIKRFEFEF